MVRITKTEIESFIKDKDDFVKINYLNRFLREADNVETRKFILLNLAGISEGRNMLKEAIKYISAATNISVTYREKMEYSMKEVELWIKLRQFDMADKSFKKAQFYGNHDEKIKLKEKYLELFRMAGRVEEQKGKVRHAIEINERSLALIQDKEKNEEILNSLLNLYEKIGDVFNANRIREKLDLR